METVGFGRRVSSLLRAASACLLVATATSCSSDGGSACGLLETCSEVSISVFPETVSVEVGDTAQLQATVGGTTNHGVTWSVISGPSVASVTSDGIVEGLSPGDAVVQATSNADSQARATVDITVTESPCSITQPIAVGQTVSGTLDAGGCVLDGYNTDLWAFSLDQTTDVVIDLTSTAFDAYLTLARFEADSLVAVDEDDDSGGGFNSRIEILLPPANYLILASTFEQGETGAYSLSLREP